MPIEGSVSLRRHVRNTLNDLKFALGLRSLPPTVARTQFRERITARRTGDLFSLTSATRPRDLATLLRLARGRHQIVELGTGTAWTTIALATHQPDCEIYSYDPIPQSHRDLYLAQVPETIRSRIHLVQTPGAAGPQTDRPVEMLYIDSFHERKNTLAEVGAWMPVMAPGGLMVFDDYTHAIHHGVADAIQELKLTGEIAGNLFIHRLGAR